MADTGPNERFWQAVRAAEEKLLRFLRTFESVQENMHVVSVADSQAHLRETAGDMFSVIPAEMAEHSPPNPFRQFSEAFGAAIRHCSNASDSFFAPADAGFSVASLNSRRELCRGLDLLYGLRAHLPILQSYWLSPEALLNWEALETRSPDSDAPVGVIHNKQGDAADFSLYVPETYTPKKDWPLVICLHGAYGRGDHYIWSWMRAAKSKGVMLLAPKSVDVTWSIMQPERDTASITAMLSEVCDTYTVDQSRVFLSGLSDGGTFTYLMGLSCPKMFAGIAPIAGDFHGMMDGMLRKKQGKNLPIYIIHGAHDHIFDVDSIRNGHQLLTNIGYNATYKELPDWGHAYTSSINEKLVLPWFESLAPEGTQDA